MIYSYNEIPVAANTVIRLLMMDRKSVPNMSELFTKIKLKIVHRVGFYYKNIDTGSQLHCCCNSRHHTHRRPIQYLPAITRNNREE